MTIPNASGLKPLKDDGVLINEWAIIDITDSFV